MKFIIFLTVFILFLNNLSRAQEDCVVINFENNISLENGIECMPHFNVPWERWSYQEINIEHDDKSTQFISSPMGGCGRTVGNMQVHTGGIIEAKIFLNIYSVVSSAFVRILLQENGSQRTIVEELISLDITTNGWQTITMTVPEDVEEAYILIIGYASPGSFLIMDYLRYVPNKDKLKTCIIYPNYDENFNKNNDTIDEIIRFTENQEEISEENTNPDGNSEVNPETDSEHIENSEEENPESNTLEQTESESGNEEVNSEDNSDSEYNSIQDSGTESETLENTEENPEINTEENTESESAQEDSEEDYNLESTIEVDSESESGTQEAGSEEISNSEHISEEDSGTRSETQEVSEEGSNPESNNEEETESETGTQEAVSKEISNSEHISEEDSETASESEKSSEENSNSQRISNERSEQGSDTNESSDEESESPIIIEPVKNSFWNPLTITGVTILSALVFVGFALLFYKLGKRRAKKQMPPFTPIYFDDLELPKAVTVPRVVNVYSSHPNQYYDEREPSFFK